VSQRDTIDVVGGMCPLLLLSQFLHEGILSSDHVVIGSIALGGSRARLGARSAALALATAAGHVAGGGVGQFQRDSVVVGDIERLTAGMGSRAGSEAVGKGHERASTRRRDVLGIGSGGWVFDVDLRDLSQGRLFVGASSTLTLVGVIAEVDGVLWMGGENRDLARIAAVRGCRGGHRLFCWLVGWLVGRTEGSCCG